MKKSEVGTWVEESIHNIGNDIIHINEPYEKKDFEILKSPCSQLRLLYDLLNFFEIHIDSVVYNKYKRFIFIDF